MNEFEPSVTGLSEERSQLEPKAAPVAIAPPPRTSSSTCGSSQAPRRPCGGRAPGSSEDPAGPKPLVHTQAELVLEPARGLVVRRERADGHGRRAVEVGDENFGVALAGGLRPHEVDG